VGRGVAGAQRLLHNRVLTQVVLVLDQLRKLLPVRVHGDDQLGQRHPADKAGVLLPRGEEGGHQKGGSASG
jgi:hypothetical protein